MKAATYDYVCVGTGGAAAAWAAAVREADPEGTVCILSSAPEEAGLVAQEDLCSSLHGDAPSFPAASACDAAWLKRNGVELVGGAVVTAVDAEARTVVTGAGYKAKMYRYSSLVLCTGAGPALPADGEQAWALPADAGASASVDTAVEGSVGFGSVYVQLPLPHYYSYSPTR